MKKTCCYPLLFSLSILGCSSIHDGEFYHPEHGVVDSRNKYFIIDYDECAKETGIHPENSIEATETGASTHMKDEEHTFTEVLPPIQLFSFFGMTIKISAKMKKCMEHKNWAVYQR